MNSPAADTAALVRAITVAAVGATVTIGAGTCALDANLPLHSPVTISGAGPTATFLVQHSSVNIFQVTAPYVTVENLNLNTSTFNAGAGTAGAPPPAVLFSAQSHTTVRNVNAEAGSGFGLRITGPQPCTTDATVGTVVQNVTITNTGSGGFAALDIDCTNGAQLSNIVVHGDYIALYQDRNVTLTSEWYTPDSRPCQAPWYVTGPAVGITIGHVQSAGGHGIISGPTTSVVVTYQSAAASCP